MIKAQNIAIFETDTPEEMAQELIGHGVSVTYEGLPLFVRRNRFGELNAFIDYPDYPSLPTLKPAELCTWKTLNPEAYAEAKAGRAACQEIRAKILRAAYGSDRQPAAFCFQEDGTAAMTRDAMEDGGGLDTIDFGACLYGSDAEAVEILMEHEAQRRAGL
jgi:hypothetical protein